MQKINISNSRIITRLVLFLFLLSFPFFSACSKKTGCPANQDLGTAVDKKGNLSTKRGSSSLFPKNMDKARKKGKKN